MATLSASYLTLADVARRQNPDKSIADIIEMLAQMSPVVKFGYAMPCNNGAAHKYTQRLSIPRPSWTAINEGASNLKSTTAQAEDTTGILEGWTETDEKLLSLTKDKAGLLVSEASAVMEGFAQEIEETFFYGNVATAPREFSGLAPRMNSTTATNGNQIVNGGGTGSDNTSIFFVTWGPKTCSLIHPENLPGGLQRNVVGMRTKDESNNTVRRVHSEQFMQHIGLAVPDWRYNVRIANIDVSNLSTGSAADLFDLMITGFYRLQSRKGTVGFNGDGAPVQIKPIIYCNTTIKEFLHKQMRTNANTYLTMREIEGEEVMSFMGCRIEETDGIVNTEATVS